MRVALLALCACLWTATAHAAPPVPVDRLGPSAALWAARSCAGEAGLGAPDECRAIMGVYVRRWEAMSRTRPGLTYTSVVRRYSSAVKRGEWHRRPWLFGLRANLRRPRGWPRRMSWDRHRDAWGRLLATARAYLEGLTSTPCPDAVHFGNRTTDGRPRGHRRATCSIPTRNLFWAR